MMKHKNLKKDKNLELEIQTHKSEYQFPNPEEIDKANIYWMVCAYFNPFMPLTDLSFAFDGLRKILKQWLDNRKKPIIYKNKTNETI
ncbi:hypothetical protein [Epilithonimonas mollis]|uniref:Uncharacterized protein n=1 Tax=Epilithonimonas mollis TaxID=216903 RepID=A0A1M6UTR9_9FLAO|nr:hypothetical protein [Epilithonimonas mollis]SHK72609.1 hypothetical protein SAMN05444371_3467 [Epilithonimonas mollis]